MPSNKKGNDKGNEEGNEEGNKLKLINKLLFDEQIFKISYNSRLKIYTAIKCNKIDILYKEICDSKYITNEMKIMSSIILKLIAI